MAWILIMLIQDYCKCIHQTFFSLLHNIIVVCSVIYSIYADLTHNWFWNIKKENYLRRLLMVIGTHTLMICRPHSRPDWSNIWRSWRISWDAQSKYQGLDSQASSHFDVFLQCVPKRIKVYKMMMLLTTKYSKVER